MSIIQEIESFQKLIKEDISLGNDIHHFEEYENILANWDKYREFKALYLQNIPSEEFYNLRKSMNKISMPNLESENNKLGEAIKNLQYENTSSDFRNTYDQE
ncbi:uncharacterized protein VNE69_05154 [Vairimorpha necatrix]|uniref:Uncharacterized protein n=1 Tax=Vairimorpha necatrix TaxID=6039 RepID=A0AAX4JCA0_9MICR